MGVVKLNMTVVVTWLVMILMVTGAAFITRGLRTDIAIPRRQGLLEMIVSTIKKQSVEVGLRSPRRSNAVAPYEFAASRNYERTFAGNRWRGARRGALVSGGIGLLTVALVAGVRWSMPGRLRTGRSADNPAVLQISFRPQF